MIGIRFIFQRDNDHKHTAITVKHIWDTQWDWPPERRLFLTHMYFHLGFHTHVKLLYCVKPIYLPQPPPTSTSPNPTGQCNDKLR